MFEITVEVRAVVVVVVVRWCGGLVDGSEATLGDAAPVRDTTPTSVGVALRRTCLSGCVKNGHRRYWLTLWSGWSQNNAATGENLGRRRGCRGGRRCPELPLLPPAAAFARTQGMDT